MAFGQGTSNNPGSVFIGDKIFDSTKIFEALKMMQNAPVNVITTNSTSAIPNTNTNSIPVRREGF